MRDKNFKPNLALVSKVKQAVFVHNFIIDIGSMFNEIKLKKCKSLILISKKLCCYIFLGNKNNAVAAIWAGDEA